MHEGRRRERRRRRGQRRRRSQQRRRSQRRRRSQKRRRIRKRKRGEERMLKLSIPSPKLNGIDCKTHTRGSVLYIPKFS
ncbi:MAG: hypothetical protein AAF587_45030 [Bacteroidota bacterium]